MAKKNVYATEYKFMYYPEPIVFPNQNIDMIKKSYQTIPICLSLKGIDGKSVRTKRIISMHQKENYIDVVTEDNTIYRLPITE